jgi:uncharacterized lipoprotein
MKSGFTRQLTTLTAVLAALLAGGCSFGDKKPEYYSASETAPLEIPQDLDRPDASSALEIDVPYRPPPSMVLQSKPPRISSTTSGVDANSELKWSSEGLYLMVEDTPESVHRRLGLVIERSGMQRIRLDDQGVYRFDYYQVFDGEDGFFSKMAFWSRDKSEDYSGAYQTFTRPEGQNTRVYIKYADGTDCEPDAAEHVLDVLRSRIG